MRFASALAFVAALAFPAEADVEMSFAGRLVIDSPVRLTLAAKGALAPWRTMTTSGMTERDDGTREFAMAAEGAPRITGEFRAWNDAAGGRIPEEPGDVATTPPSSRDGEGAVATSAGKMPALPGVEAEWLFTPEADARMEQFDLMGDLRMSDYGGGTVAAYGEGAVATPAGKMPALPGVEAEWLFTPEADARMELFGLMGDLRMSDYGGGTVAADGEAVALPSATAEPFDIRRENLSRLELADKHGGRRLAFDFREPVDLFIQYWGGRTMSFRLILPPDDRAALLYRGGRRRTLAFSLFGAGTLRRTPPLAPVTLAAGPDWIPLHAENPIEEGGALDFSGMRPTGRPCGAFGRVVARGGHFEFEGLPGVPQRFYGANLCYWACFPKDLADARDLARTLARVGYNAVRIHHHDGYCVAKDDPAATRLDEAMMRRMDALVTACSEEGLYISTDLFVSRTNRGIAWRAVGVDRDGDLSMADMKKCAPIHEGVFSNYVAFASNWLNHVNAYTGLRYAEEPALAWINLVNEGDLDEGASARPGYQKAWTTWLAVKKGLFTNGNCPQILNDTNANIHLRDAVTPCETNLHFRFVNNDEHLGFVGNRAEGEWNGIPATIPNGLGKNRHGRAYLLFLRDVEARFVARMRGFLRGIGCRALVSDMNDAWGCTAAFQKVRGEALDYVDSHCYVDHPAFLEKAWRRPSWCDNENPFKGEAQGAAAVSALRVFGKPFTVSEWDFCGPGRHRGVGGIAFGAEAALQDWAGIWRFEWSGNTHAAHKPGTLPSGYFDVAFDPFKLASERAGVCLFLRRDLEPLEAAYAVALPEEKLSTPDALIGASARVDWVAAAWLARIGCAVEDADSLREALKDAASPVIHAGDFDEAWAKSAEEAMREIKDCQKRQLDVDGANPNANPENPAILSKNKSGVSIDRENGVFLVATPRTCGVFAESGEHAAGVLRAKIGGGAATVFATSLDGEPLATSSRILVTHLTDVQNSGAEYADAGMRINKEAGRLPYLMRRGVAGIELQFANGPAEWRVWALSPSGARRAEVPCLIEGGTLRFTADVARDPAEATFLYELAR